IRPCMSANQRRSQRILLAVPLRVSGKRSTGTPFMELTNTLIVNAHGALMVLREPVGGRSNIGGEEYNHRRRVGVHGGGCKSRAEWSAGDWIRVRETVSALLASVVSAGGLEHAQSGSQAVCVGSERCRKARKGARSQEIA